MALLSQIRGIVFTLAGAGNLAAAAIIVARQAATWLQCGIWPPATLGRELGAGFYFKTDHLPGVVDWVLATPVSLWAALIGGLLLRQGLRSLPRKLQTSSTASAMESSTRVGR